MQLLNLKLGVFRCQNCKLFHFETRFDDYFKRNAELCRSCRNAEGTREFQDQQALIEKNDLVWTAVDEEKAILHPGNVDDYIRDQRKAGTKELCYTPLSWKALRVFHFQHLGTILQDGATFMGVKNHVHRDECHPKDSGAHETP